MLISLSDMKLNCCFVTDSTRFSCWDGSLFSALFIFAESLSELEDRQLVKRRRNLIAQLIEAMVGSQVQTGPFGSLPWVATRYARLGVRLSPWLLPGYILAVWMVEPAVSKET